MEKSKVIEKLFSYIVIYSYLILPLLFLILKHKKRDGLILAAYGVIFFLLLFFYFDVPAEYRKFYQSLYTFLEYFFFALLFYMNLKNKKFKLVIILLSILFVTFQVIHYLFIEKNRVDSIQIGVESILIFIFIVFFFSENLNINKGGYIYNHHCFWISVGILIYLGGSFFINILANTFSTEEFAKYWYLNYIADTIKTLFFAIAFLFITNENTKKNFKTSDIPHLDII